MDERIRTRLFTAGTWLRRRAVLTVVATAELLVWCQIGLLVWRWIGTQSQTAVQQWVPEVSAAFGLSVPVLDPSILGTRLDGGAFFAAVAPLAALFGLLRAVLPIRWDRRRSHGMRSAFLIGLFATPAMGLPTIPQPEISHRWLVAAGEWMSTTPWWLVVVIGICNRMLSVSAGAWDEQPRPRSLPPRARMAFSVLSRLLTAAAFTGVLLAVLGTTAAVRDTLLNPAIDQELSGAYVQSAYLPLAAGLAMIACELKAAGHPGFFRLILYLAALRGLWPGPALGFFEESPVALGWFASLGMPGQQGPLWGAFCLYMPTAWLLIVVVTRLLRWQVLRGLAPGPL
ncbi:hypothetical protein ACIBH1_36230 [Nonomuraea sp. NPDC050663]|uniref:hypothetical protein n=1 Tax=Nonomuraea sp. NPDC050663 TaxID=3364370 RepID=UPI0037B2D653